MKQYNIARRTQIVHRLTVGQKPRLRKLLIGSGCAFLAIAIVWVVYLALHLWLYALLVGGLSWCALYTYVLCSNNLVARKLFVLTPALRFSHSLQRYANRNKAREQFSFSGRDVDYVGQLALGRPAMVEFGSMRPLTDIDFPYHLLHRNFLSSSSFNEPIKYSVEFGSQQPHVRSYTLKHLSNTSAMSMGALNYKLIEAITVGQRGLGLVNTGEGGLGPHLVGGADLVLQIGTAKYGFCKIIHQDGQDFRALDTSKLVRTIKQYPQIKLIEIKLSQGAKPGVVHLPAIKVTKVVANIRGIEPGKATYSPSEHFELRSDSLSEKIDKLGLWIVQLRKATKLPVGIKLSIGDPRELEQLVKQLAANKTWPDFITVDGADGGTSGGLAYLTHHVGYGDIIEGLTLLDVLLRKYKIRDKLIVCAAGKLHTPAAAAVAFSAGAQVIFVARAFIYAAAADNDIHRYPLVSPYALTFGDPLTLSAIDIAKTARAVRSYSAGFDHDVRQLTRVLGRSSPLDIDKGSVKNILC